MTKKKKKPPPGEYSAFKNLLDKIAKVPKSEIDQREREYQAEGDHRQTRERKRRTGN